MKILEEELVKLWDVICPKCNSAILNKNGRYRGRQRFICLDCGFSFTTYSKSLLNSTKLTEDQWQKIITGVIENKKLSEISKDANVSSISISKIRRRIFDALFGLSRFVKTLNKYYYDPFDSTSIFLPDKENGTLYYYKYNEQSVIAFLEYHPDIYVSRAYDIKEFNILLSSIHYPKLDFTPFSQIDKLSAIDYIDNLLVYLKSYRGIKKELLTQYCNFYDFKVNLSTEDLTEIILDQLASKVKTNA